MGLMIYGGNRVMMPHPRPVRRRYEMLRGLGLAFSDLPNGGHNLRLYTYDPMGSQFGPKNSCGSEPTNTWIYNTGHYDISLGTPCSQPDTQGFCDWDTMAAYAQQRGEMLVLVTRADLTALCGYRAPVSTATVKPTSGPTAPTGSGLTPGRTVSPTTTTPGSPGGTVATTITTTTTPGSVTGGGGGGGLLPGGGASGGGVAPGPDNTLLIVGLAALAFVMLK